MPRLSKTRKEMLTTLMKESIFEAATSVLCERGVDGTTMDRVATAANVAKSSLYDYFPSKGELLDFVFDRIVTPFVQTIEGLVSAQMPAPEKLEAILRTALDKSTQHRAILRMLAQSHEGHQLKQNSRPRVMEAFTAIIEQGIEEGMFRSHNPAHTARMFMGCLSELFELQASNASDEVASEYVGVLIDAAVHGMSIHVEKGRPSDD